MRSDRFNTEKEGRALEQRLAECTEALERRSAEVETLHRELEAFTYSVAHDLRAPLITIDGFAQVLRETSAHALDEAALGHLDHIQKGVERMNRMIEGLLALSKIVRAPVSKTTVDLTAIAHDVANGLRSSAPQRAGDFTIAPGLQAQCDPALIRIVLENLLSNAWKFTSKREHAQIVFDTVQGAEDNTVFRVKDNGAGFDPRYATRLFGPFQRCHSQSEFPGIGMGLATAQRIVHRHGGKIWVETQPDRGASFFFTLPG